MTNEEKILQVEETPQPKTVETIVHPVVDAPVIAEHIVTVPVVTENVVAAPVVREHKVAEHKVPETIVAAPAEDDLNPADIVFEHDLGANLSSAHDDFDWNRGTRGQILYSDSERASYLDQYNSSMRDLSAGQIVSGRVSAITGNDVVLDIGYKSDGLLALSDFRDIPGLKIDDYVDVYVESQEDAKGQLQLSRRKAKLLRSWEALIDSFKNGTIIRGTIISKTKGGLIVDANGLETFLPGSQIDIKPVNDYDQYVGKVMEFKVVKINENIKNAVVSHKALIESDLAEQRQTILGGLEKGQVLEGTVKNITDFGAFLDLGGVDGLLYITDISWGRITNPREVLEMNQKLNVVVLDFDDNKKRISLGLKQLLPHPWEVLDSTITEGSIVKGKIVNIEDYGAFLEIKPGVEGLVHISEVSWANTPIASKEFFKLNQEMEARVVNIDRNDRKMSLSIKQLTGDPWAHVDEKYPVGSKHTGDVKNTTPYGVFVELEPGVGGMIHISDLSWTKRYVHPNEFTKVGNKIEVQILESDKDNRKLSLGHKQLETNPWENFETVFTIGSEHTGTVLRKDDRGAIIQMPHGLEAFAPVKQIKKEDGTNAEAGDSLPFRVIEFNRDEKRIIVSHARINEDAKKAADDADKKAKVAEEQEAHKDLETVQANVEHATMGDIEGLAELKDKIVE